MTGVNEDILSISTNKRLIVKNIHKKQLKWQKYTVK